MTDVPNKIVGGEAVPMTSAETEAWLTDQASLASAAPGGGSLPMSSISDRQFFQALASAPYKLIAEEEAEDAVATGTIPAVMQAVVDALPDDQRFPVRMLLRGATTFERANPLVNVFGASQGMDAEAIDAFWGFASTL